MRGKLAKVTAQIAALKAARLAKVGPRIVAAELSAIGCRAKVWPNGEGLTVDTWDGTPELDAARKRKLAELEAKGISALVVVIDRLEDRGATGNGDRVDGAAGALTPVGPATPGARVTDPTTTNGSKHV